MAATPGFTLPNLAPPPPNADLFAEVQKLGKRVKGISLQQYSKSLPNRVIRETTARRIFKQVAEATAYLHSNNIVHRDIKLDNVLIEEGSRMVKLIDYGFSVVVCN